MALTKLNVGRSIELTFRNRKEEVIPEAKTMLLRNGQDLENELKSRKNLPDDHTFTLSRTPLGELEVTVTYRKKQEPNRVAPLS